MTSSSQVALKPKLLVSVSIVLISVVLDQITKVLAAQSLKGSPGYSYLGGLIRLQYAENSGAFLSLGASLDQNTRTLLFIIGVLIIIGFCLLWLLKSAHTWTSVTALAAVISGGVGNLIDRISRGTVIDFIYMELGPLHTGVFNVADMAITGGLFVMLYDQYVTERQVKARGDKT